MSWAQKWSNSFQTQVILVLCCCKSNQPLLTCFRYHFYLLNNPQQPYPPPPSYSNSEHFECGESNLYRQRETLQTLGGSCCVSMRTCLHLHLSLSDPPSNILQISIEENGVGYFESQPGMDRQPSQQVPESLFQSV